jgi:hypothetical protein
VDLQRIVERVVVCSGRFFVRTGPYRDRLRRFTCDGLLADGCLWAWQREADTDWPH